MSLNVLQDSPTTNLSFWNSKVPGLLEKSTIKF